MTACGLLALAIASGTAPAKGPAVDFNKDPVVKNGLFALSASVGEPGQPRDKLLLPSAGRSYYFLWTLERMAVIYNLKTIGGKDWYEWGKELLLANQQADGSWQGEFAEGGCDTCFALLFLQRVNVASDLTIIVGDKVKDPAGGSRMVNLHVEFTVRFPDGEAGDSARNALPRAVRMSHERLCTVSRTIEAGTSISNTVTP